MGTISATEIVSQHRKPENSDFPRSSCAAARHSLGSVIGWPASHQLPVPAFATYAGGVGDGGGRDADASGEEGDLEAIFGAVSSLLLDTVGPARRKKGPAALLADGAPSASLDHLLAPAAPTHPGAPPGQLGSLRWPQLARLRLAQR